MKLKLREEDKVWLVETITRIVNEALASYDSVSFGGYDGAVEVPEDIGFYDRHRRRIGFHNGN